MNRAAKRIAIAILALVTLATVGIAFVSFARKVDSFSTAGLTARADGNALEILTVEPDGAAARAGLAAGDRIVLADGQTAASLPHPEKLLSRKPFPHRLVVISHGEVRGVSVGEPSVRPDVKYLFLAFVGFLYLIIGLFTVARERSRVSGIFWALCLSSFAVYVITPAGPRDDLWKASWLAEDLFRALLPALFLHFFLLFPRPVRASRIRLLPLLYVPAAAYVAAQLALLPVEPTPRLAAWLEGVERFWFGYFVVYVAAVLVRLLHLLRHARDAEADKQLRWIGLGVIVGLAPFLILSALPRAFGLESPLLSTIAVVPLVFIPLAFAYAILKWRLWDVEIFVREAMGTTAAVLLGGVTFVLLNSLLDRTLEGMAAAGKNVIAFGSGLILASLLVPVKKRITDVLERIQYHDTYRARRALLDIARDFATPRPREEVVQAIVRRVEEALRVVPCSLFLFEGPARDPDVAVLAEFLNTEDRLTLRGGAFGTAPPPALLRLHALGYRSFFAMRCGGELVGALGVGHKDGRVPLSSEDDQLLTAVIAQASLAYENARLYGALAERLEQIRTLQEYQESVIRSSSSGIVVVDAQERIHTANPAFAELLGLSEESLAGLPLSEVLPGVTLGEPPAEGDEWRFQTRLPGARGEERDLQLSVSAFRGAPDRRVVVVEDMTDRLRAERALAERERLASLGVLAAGVAHEVNTPIAGLSSYAQLLLSETSPGDPRYSILKKMERQTFRAAHLVNNLLEFARPRQRTPQKTDLRAVLANAAESVETALAGRELEIDADADGEPAFVIGDARELEQVFVNLLTNARDASPDGGVVSCRLERCGETVRVTVSDRGTGLSATAAERVFQPFYTTKKSGGTGLGLAISRDIVRRHGGEILLASREGGGAEARVELPLVPAGSPS
ncbi:MAG TPA: ATP-binding protein [Thermoanaerobaculia bacterium]